MTNSIPATEPQLLTAAAAIRAVALAKLEQLTEEHQQILRSELGDTGVELALRYGVKSLTREQAISEGYRVWKGKDVEPAASSGILFPFSGDFGQIRWDEALLDAKGRKVGKYRNRAGASHAVAIIGDPDKPATWATEGWKDAARLHLETGETVVALPGVTSWRLLPETVRFLVYDADAATNPNVWGQLTRAGLERPLMKVALFPAAVAGPTGGACEYLGNGGDLDALQWFTGKTLVRQIWQFWTKSRSVKGKPVASNVRPDWKERSILLLGKRAYAAGFGRVAADDLMRSGGKQLGIPADTIRVICSRVWRLQPEAADDSPDVSNPQQLQQFISERHQLAFDDLGKRFVLDGVPMRPEDAMHFDQWLAARYGIDVKRPQAVGALHYLGMKTRLNPVEQYLRSLRDRDDLTLVDPRDLARAFGFADDDDLSRDMLLRHLVGGLKRGLKPGFKHDQVLILQGGQGWKKTEAIASLAPEDAWTDSETDLRDFNSWPFLLRIGACWNFALDECEQVLRSRTAAETKGMITRRFDHYALKFQNEVTAWPRPSIIWGTTNASELLSDYTGARRFWICPLVQPCDPQWISQHRDRIWFTVWQLAEWGLRNFYDPDSPAAEAAQARASTASAEDPWVQAIDSCLSALPKECKGIAVDSLATQALEIAPKDLTTKDRGRINRIVEGQGFTTHRGTVMWKKDKRRWESGAMPRAGFRPVPVEQEQPEPPTERDYSWVADPVEVFQCSSAVPQGWNGKTPWYDKLSASLFQCSTLSTNKKEEQYLEREGEEEKEEVEGESKERDEKAFVYIGNGAETLERWNGDPKTQSPTAVEPNQGAETVPEQLERPPERPLSRRQAPDFIARSEWVDPVEPLGPNGRPRFLRVKVVADDAPLVLAQKEVRETGGARGYGNEVVLTETLRQRLQQREAG